MKTKESQGITLIALVITIIVMLILVAVTINLAVNGGLFGYAGKAVEDTKKELDKEKQLGNFEENLTTEDLIARVTSNREEDLAKLKLYFEGKSLGYVYDENNNCFIDNEIIPDASRSISILENSKDIIKYHNNLYRTIFNMLALDIGGDVIIFTSVEALSDEEALAIKIKDGGFVISQTKTVEIVDEPAIQYYIYNNKYYRLNNFERTVEEIQKNENEVLVIAWGNHIKFTPTANQTWYDWASDTSDSTDLDFNDIQEGLTLKKLIKDVDSKDDKKIQIRMDIPGREAQLCYSLLPKRLELSELSDVMYEYSQTEISPKIFTIQTN